MGFSTIKKRIKVLMRWLPGSGICRRVWKKLITSAFSPIYIHVENSSFQKHSVANAKSAVDYEILGVFEGDYVIGSVSGVLYLNNSGVYRLFSGPTYGITRRGNTYIAEQTMGSFSRLISFEIEVENGIPQYRNLQTIRLIFSRKIHQIDRYGCNIFICDTYKNRLLILNEKTGRFRSIYPDGKAKNGNKSKNYHHFNSVFVTDDIIYLMAHNETKKTGRKSELYLLDASDFNVIDIQRISCDNAHNIALYWDLCFVIR